MYLPEAPMCPHVPPGGPHVPPGAYRGACRVAERLLWATGMYLGSYRDMPWELPGGIPRWDPVGNCVEEPGLKKGK